jgi:hypothetical protein
MVMTEFFPFIHKPAFKLEGRSLSLSGNLLSKGAIQLIGEMRWGGVEFSIPLSLSVS